MKKSKKLQQAEDMKAVKKILPSHYKVTESEKPFNIHCVSKTGMPDSGKELEWNKVMDAFRKTFGKRLSEVFHNVCANHSDFTIFLKS